MKHVVSAFSRPHVYDQARLGACWCNPMVCECCGGAAHRDVDLRPSEEMKMGCFSEQIPSAEVRNR